MADQLLHSDRRRLKSSEWFQREIFEGTLLLIPCSALFYLLYQILMEAPWIQVSYTIMVAIGCLLIRRLNRSVGTKAAHICFMTVILGLYIPSWIHGGGTLSPTRFVSVIFFSLHLVLFPTFRLLYVVIIWLFFTSICVGIEYVHPEWITGRFIEQVAPLPMLLEQLIIHALVFVSCGLLLKHTINAFLRTESRLHSINQNQRDLLRITSHDLRGPVNNLQLGIEALIAALSVQTTTKSDSNHTPPVDSSKELILQLAPTLKLQVQHMDFLMRNLSYFRLNHNEKLRPFLESISSHEFITQIVDGWRLHAERQQLSLELSMPKQKSMMVTDRMFLKQILDNLLSNAIKYTGTHSTIKTIVSTEKNHLFIDICDQGTGINHEEQQRIFKCFERVGNPNRPREHSIGLGLWIVSLLSPLIHGEVTVLHSDHSGTTFRLSLWEVLLESDLSEDRDVENEPS